MTTRLAYTSFHGLHVHFGFTMLVDIDNAKIGIGSPLLVYDLEWEVGRRGNFDAADVLEERNLRRAVRGRDGEPKRDVDALHIARR